MLVNRADFARTAGVTKAAVTQGIAKGRIYCNPKTNLIDTEHDVNAAYLRGKQKGHRRGPRPGRVPAPKKPDSQVGGQVQAVAVPGETPTNGNGHDAGINAALRIEEYLEALRDRKSEADIRRINASATKANVDTAHNLGRLVETRIVQRYAGILGAELRTRLIEMPRRLAPQLLELAKTGADEFEIAGVIEAEMADAIGHAKEVARGVTLTEFADALDK